MLPQYVEQNVVVIYFQSIIEPRLKGTVNRNLRLMSGLYKKFYSNLFLATTFWDCLLQTAEGLQTGELREAELANSDGFYGCFTKDGANVIRISKIASEARATLLSLTGHLVRARPPVPPKPMIKRKPLPQGPRIEVQHQKRPTTLNDLANIKAEHEKQKQDVLDQHNNFIAQGLERRRTLEDEQRAICDRIIKAREAEEHARHEEHRRTIELEKEQYTRLERSIVEQLDVVNQSLSMITVQHQGQHTNSRQHRWQHHCERITAELAVLQRARDAHRTNVQFYARIETISCTVCFAIVRRNEQYFGKLMIVLYI